MDEYNQLLDIPDFLKPVYNPLHCAASNGDIKSVEAILNENAPIDHKDIYDRTPLFEAILLNRTEATELLLKRGADVNSIDVLGKSPLHCAFESRWPEISIIRMLLTKGADINAKDKVGITPLHLALRNGDQEIVIMLLIKGADVNHSFKLTKASQEEITPLHFALEKGYQAICEMLLTKGADVNAKRKAGITPLHMAVRKGYHEISRIILSKGADINAKTEDGIPPLHLALEFEHKGFILMLLNQGADVNAKGKDGNTLLHLAVQRSRHDIIETILKYDADINSKNENDRSPFYFAFENNDIKIVETLLEHGCDVDDVNLNHAVKRNLFVRGFRGYIDCFDKVTILFIHHIVKMLAANLNVSKQHLGLMANIRKSKLSNIRIPNILKIRISDFDLECQEQIAIMKSKKINNTDISFYDILTKNTNSLVIYMRNKNILQVLKSGNYEKKFPIYATMIKCNFRKGMERKELLEKGYQIFHFSINNFAELPLECTEKIFSYLSNRDIRVFKAAFKPLSINSPNTDEEVTTSNVNFFLI